MYFVGQIQSSGIQYYMICEYFEESEVIMKYEI